MLSVIMYFHPDDPNSARLLCRWVDRDGLPTFASRGLHELCIKRQGSCLQLRRWSVQKEKAKLWAVLYFKTYESKSPFILDIWTKAHECTEMVLFHDTFVTLKAHCPKTILCHPEELCLGQEKRLFRGLVSIIAVPFFESC
jgi:hypothetical protein